MWHMTGSVQKLKMMIPSFPFQPRLSSSSCAATRRAVSGTRASPICSARPCPLRRGATPRNVQPPPPETPLAVDPNLAAASQPCRGGNGQPRRATCCCIERAIRGAGGGEAVSLPIFLLLRNAASAEFARRGLEGRWQAQSGWRLQARPEKNSESWQAQSCRRVGSQAFFIRRREMGDEIRSEAMLAPSSVL
jgi:hypothetical protein